MPGLRAPSGALVGGGWGCRDTAPAAVEGRAAYEPSARERVPVDGTPLVLSFSGSDAHRDEPRLADVEGLDDDG